MTQSFLLLLVVLLKGPESVGFVVNLMKFGKNACLSAPGVEMLGIPVGPVKKQLTRQIKITFRIIDSIEGVLITFGAFFIYVE
jgi:hypothetical protein